MRKKITYLSRLIVVCAFVMILVSLTLAQEQAAGTIEVASLGCDGRSEPVGLDQADGIKFLRTEPAGELGNTLARAVYEVGSGKYQFLSTIK